MMSKKNEWPDRWVLFQLIVDGDGLEELTADEVDKVMQEELPKLFASSVGEQNNLKLTVLPG